MRDRLNTKDLMIRKHWTIDSGSSCVLCTGHNLETRDHLFFLYPFATAWWDFIGIHWDGSLSISQRFIRAKRDFLGPCFLEIATCAAWNLWKECNGHIFENQTPSLARWKVRFQHDLLLHQHRVKPALVQPLIDWALSIFS